MRKYTKGQAVIVVARRGYGEDMTLTGLRGKVVSSGSKNATVTYVEDGVTCQDSFDIETGVRNGRYSGGKTLYTEAQWARFQAVQGIEGSFDVVEESSTRYLVLAVTVRNRDSLWYETLGEEFEPRRVRLSFSQHNGGSIILDKIELGGPTINQDTLAVEDHQVTIGRAPGCYRVDLRSDDKVGTVNRNSLPEWAWAVAEKVWPNVSTL